jgi:hypothetical protein
MKRYLLLSLVAGCAMILLLAPRISRANRPIEPKIRFAPVHIYLDSGGAPLAAYQFELIVAWGSRPWSQNHGQDARATGQVKIVGVEGGAHPAFREAPYYDPAALMNERIVIAAFHTGRDLPTGRTRIATIHLQIPGDADPQYELNLTTAADAAGERLPVRITLEKGEQK